MRVREGRACLLQLLAAAFALTIAGKVSDDERFFLLELLQTGRTRQEEECMLLMLTIDLKRSKGV